MELTDKRLFVNLTIIFGCLIISTISKEIGKKPDQPRVFVFPSEDKESNNSLILDQTAIENIIKKLSEGENTPRQNLLNDMEKAILKQMKQDENDETEDESSDEESDKKRDKIQITLNDGDYSILGSLPDDTEPEDVKEINLKDLPENDILEILYGGTEKANAIFEKLLNGSGMEKSSEHQQDKKEEKGERKEEKPAHQQNFPNHQQNFTNHQQIFQNQQESFQRVPNQQQPVLPTLDYENLVNYQQHQQQSQGVPQGQRFDQAQTQQQFYQNPTTQDPLFGIADILSSLTGPANSSQQFYQQPQSIPQQFYQQPQSIPQQFYQQPQSIPQQFYQPQSIPQQFYQQPQGNPQQPDTIRSPGFQNYINYMANDPRTANLQSGDNNRFYSAFRVPEFIKNLEAGQTDNDQLQKNFPYYSRLVNQGAKHQENAKQKNTSEKTSDNTKTSKKTEGTSNEVADIYEIDDLTVTETLIPEKYRNYDQFNYEEDPVEFEIDYTEEYIYV